MSSRSSTSSDPLMKRDDGEVTVISEKDGHTTIAHNATPNGRISAGGERSPSLKSQPQRTPSTGNVRPPTAPGSRPPPSTTASPSLASSLAAAAAGHVPPPPGFPGASTPAGLSSLHDPRSSFYAASLMAAASGAVPSFSGAPPPALPPSSLYPPGAVDPLRDPYRALSLYGAAAAVAGAAKDPLREARERELLRLNPLSSMIAGEQERARLAAMAYPPSTSTAALFPPPPGSLPVAAPGFPKVGAGTAPLGLYSPAGAVTPGLLPGPPPAVNGHPPSAGAAPSSAAATR